MSVCPRFVLALSHLLMTSLLAFPLMLALHHMVEPTAGIPAKARPQVASPVTASFAHRG